MNDTLKKILLYGLGGVLPLWLLESVVLPRLSLPVPLLLPLCVVVAAVLEGAFSGARFGLLVGLLWALTYSGASPWRIALLTLVGMASGAVSQYALRRGLSGALVCSGALMALLSAMNVLGGLISDIAPATSLLRVALGESAVSLLWAPVVYFWFYKLYRKAGGKPA